MKLLKTLFFAATFSILILNFLFITSTSDINAEEAQQPLCMVYGGEVTNPDYPEGAIYHCSPCAIWECDIQSGWMVN